MAFPSFWVVLFFFTMILIGIDTQFALVETLCYFVEDLLVKAGHHALDPTLLRGLICLLLFLLGLPVATGGGSYVIALLDTFGYAIPAALVNLLQVLIWVRCTDFEKGMRALFERTQEELPTLSIGLLEHTSPALCAVMLAICFYLTLADGFLRGDFTPKFMLIGLAVLLASLSPTLYYFLKHRHDPIERNPFGPLDDHHRDRLLSHELVHESAGDSAPMPVRELELKNLA